MSYHELPDAIRPDIEIAISILKSLGAREVFVFGSAVSRDGREPRDIDIAVTGLPKNRYFRAYGQLLIRLRHEVDLVDLDDDAPFVRTLKETGRLERVA